MLALIDSHFDTTTVRFVCLFLIWKFQKYRNRILIYTVDTLYITIFFLMKSLETISFTLARKSDLQESY